MTTSRKQPLCRAPRVALTRELTVPLCMYLLALQIHGCFLILDEESIIKLMFWNINFSEFGEKKAVSLGKKMPRRPRRSLLGGRDFHGRKFTSRSCCELSYMKIPSSRLAAPGSPGAEDGKNTWDVNKTLNVFCAVYRFLFQENNLRGT